MDLTRRGFLKGLAKVVVVAGVVAVAPKTALSKIANQPKKFVHSMESGGAVLLEPDRLVTVGANEWCSDARNKYAKSAAKAIGEKVDEDILRESGHDTNNISAEFVRQYEKNLREVLSQKGSRLLGGVSRVTFT